MMDRFACCFVCFPSTFKTSRICTHDLRFVKCGTLIRPGRKYRVFSIVMTLEAFVAFNPVVWPVFYDTETEMFPVYANLSQLSPPQPIAPTLLSSSFFACTATFLCCRASTERCICNTDWADVQDRRQQKWKARENGGKQRFTSSSLFWLRIDIDIDLVVRPLIVVSEYAARIVKMHGCGLALDWSGLRLFW